MALKTYTPTTDKIVHTTSVDFNIRPSIFKPVHLVQYDNQLPIIAVALYNNGQPYAVPDGLDANIRLGKKDRKFVSNPALGCSTDRKTLYFEVTTQMVTDEGKTFPIVELVTTDKIAGSSPICVLVERNPVQEGDIESSDEAKSFFQYVEDAKDAAESASGSASAAATSAANAKKSETAAAGSATNAKNSADAAKASQTAAAGSATNAKNSADAAKASQTAAASSASSASTSATNAKNSETAAKKSQTAAAGSASAAMESQTAAASSASAAATSAANAKNSETAAKKSETAAAGSATNAAASATKATSDADRAKGYADGIQVDWERIEEARESAETSASSASTSATNAKNSADAAKASQTAAAGSATNAAASAKTATDNAAASKTSADAAKASQTAAAGSANDAAESASAAMESQTAAAGSAAAAAASAKTVDNAAKLAQSYAVGETGTRVNENVDNAKYYYEQAKGVSQGLAGALLPMGTISFAQLQKQTKEPGYMYNISDAFTTDSSFKEGAGHPYPAGTNVYWTADRAWDCLAGSTVTGVKGHAEINYRVGNVDITPANIGAVAKTGDTMTGDLTLSGTSRMIKFSSGLRNGGSIQFFTGTKDGSGIMIGDGGRTIIGAGESAGTLRNVLGTTAADEAAENLYLGADSTVTVHTNCNAIANRQTFIFGTDGKLTAPVGFVGNLTGKATSAGTADQVGHSLTFSGGVTGSWNGTENKSITIPTSLPANGGTAASCTGNAGTASKLLTARSLKTNLASTTAVTFDGSANQDNIPVTGILGIANGGTGNSTGTADPIMHYSTTATEINKFNVKTGFYNVETADIGLGASQSFNRIIALGGHKMTPTGYSTEIAFPYNGGVAHNPYLRCSTTSTWTAWRKLAFVDDITTSITSDTTHVKKTGDIMTGNLTFSSSSAIGIKYNSSTRNGSPITFYPDSVNGSGIVIGDGGRTIIGAGESANSLRGALTASDGDETLHLSADFNIYLYTNCNNIANRHPFTFTTDGRLNGLATPTATTDAANKSYVDTAVGTKQNKLKGKAGQVVGFDASGNAVAVSSKITIPNLIDLPEYFETGTTGYINIATGEQYQNVMADLGDAGTNLNLVAGDSVCIYTNADNSGGMMGACEEFVFTSDGRLSGVANPKGSTDAANKKYVDESIRQAIQNSWSGLY